MQFEPREHVSAWSAALAPIFAVAVALALCSVLIIWTGVPVLEAYGLLLKGAFGSKFAISETLTRATPLMLTGLAAAVAFRAKFWNIGAEGQLYCGALAVTWLGTGVVQLPPFLMIPLLCTPKPRASTSRSALLVSRYESRSSMTASASTSQTRRSGRAA